MMVIINAATALAFLIHATSVISADLAAPILGCDAVGCRSGSNASLFNCSVGGTYSSSIGIAVFKSSVSQDNFTWTEIIDGNASPNFYLGSPVGPSLKEKAASSGFGSCAVFLPLVAPSGPNPKNMTLTCNDTIGKSCVDALVAQAIAVFGSSSSSCDALQSEFQKSLPAECSSSLATNSTTGSTDVIDLTGPNAPTPINQAENSTSNCWPTLPHNNSLTRITLPASHVANNPSFPTYVQPILTVFFPKTSTNTSNTTAILTKPEALLTCVKPIDVLPGKTSGATLVTSKLGAVLGYIMMIWFLVRLV